MAPRTKSETSDDFSPLAASPNLRNTLFAELTADKASQSSWWTLNARIGMAREDKWLAVSDRGEIAGFVDEIVVKSHFSTRLNRHSFLLKIN
jgi:hypothetical protein